MEPHNWPDVSCCVGCVVMANARFDPPDVDNVAAATAVFYFPVLGHSLSHDAVRPVVGVQLCFLRWLAVMLY